MILNQKSELLYSVVTPVFETGQFLEELLREIDSAFRELDKPYEVICVEDASPDDSWEIMKSIKSREDYPLRIVRLSKNFGQHKAILAGLSITKGKAAVVIDSDLQTPPEEIKKLIKTYESKRPDVVYGIYDKKKHASWRNLGSWLLGWVLLKFGSYAAKGSSFKIIDQKIIQKITRTSFEYIFIDEMIGWFTDNFAYTEVKHLERKEGKSSYNFLSLFRMALKIIINYTAVPLKMMTYGGLFTAFICFIIGLVFIYRWAVLEVPIGFTATIVVISFGFSIIIFCLGIIGDYLRRLYFSLLNKPSFTIKEIIE